MNRSLLATLGFALALSSPAFAQHRNSNRGEERHDNGGAPRTERRQESSPAPRAEPRQQRQEQPQRQAQPQQQRQEQRAVPRQSQPQQAVPREQYRAGTPYRGAPQQYAAPRSVTPRVYDSRRYDAGRSYSGRYYGSRYSGPRFAVAPRHFYRPYYVFRPRLSIGFGIWAGYPVSYYDPYYYPYAPYSPSSGSVYVAPNPGNGLNQANMGGLSFDITPDDAEVWVDGNYMGVVGDFTASSQPLGLPGGHHHMELREPGYQVSSFDVDIIPGQVIPYQGALQN